MVDMSNLDISTRRGEPAKCSAAGRLLDPQRIVEQYRQLDAAVAELGIPGIS
jgi:hypothetical protein